MAATASATSSAVISGMPAASIRCRTGWLIAVSAKPGHSALTDVFGGQGRAEGAGQAHDGVLGRGVDRVLRYGGEPGQAGGEDQGAAAAGPDGGQRGVHAEERAVDVDAERAPVGGQVPARSVAEPHARGRYAGVEEGHVEAAERADRSADRLLIVGLLADVAADEPAAYLGCDPGATLVHVGDNDLGAAAGQVPGRGRPDAVGAAGDQDHRAVQVDGHQGWPAVAGVCSSPRIRASMTVTARSMLGPISGARSAITSEYRNPSLTRTMAKASVAV